MMSKGTKTGTGRKRLALIDRAHSASSRRFFWGHQSNERIAYTAGYLAGWRAAKREGKR